MFRIGIFSKLSQVSVKTLRYYDGLDLLKPARVDKFSGYRYYSASQLARLNQILALKDMGLSLEQITTFLAQGLNPAQLQGMLRLKQAELHQELAEGQARLERVEAWLTQFEQEALMSDYAVIIKPVEALRVAEARAVASGWEQLSPTLNRLFDQTCGQIMEQGGKLIGPGIAVYYDQGSPATDTDLDVGACMAFSGTVRDGDGVKLIELPAFDTMASVVHHGSFATMNRAYEAILKWIEANDYRVCGPNRELNLEYERDGDQSRYVTEIQFPVAKA